MPLVCTIITSLALQRSPTQGSGRADTCQGLATDFQRSPFVSMNGLRTRGRVVGILHLASLKRRAFYLAYLHLMWSPLVRLNKNCTYLLYLLASGFGRPPSYPTFPTSVETWFFSFLHSSDSKRWAQMVAPSMPA